MPCMVLLTLMPLGPYAYRQIRTFRNLIHLLRHPGSIAQFGLSGQYTIGLCVWPGLMLLVLTLTMLAAGDAQPRGRVNVATVQ